MSAQIHTARLEQPVSDGATRSRLGVRGRLLLAFFGVSAFAVLGAAVALYSFNRFGDALNLITQRRIPPALTSQELSHHAERIVSAAPALAASANWDDKSNRSLAIYSELSVLDWLLKNSGIENKDLASLAPYVQRLHGNLEEINLLVVNRLKFAEQKRDLLRQVVEISGAMQQLLGPWVSVMDEKIAQWRRIAVDPAVPPDRRQLADREFAAALAWFRSLQRSQVVASDVNDMLQRAASTEDGNGLTVMSFRLTQSLNELQRLTTELDPKLQPLMTQLISRFRPLASGARSIPAMRKAELDLVANAARLLGENAVLSKDLTGTVDSLVKNARADITDANNEALSVVSLSTWVLVITVAMSLLSSILIVWLLARKIVVPIQTLGAGAERLGAGDLNQRIAIKTGDELEALAHQFNEMAGKLQESYAGLEQKVAQRTAELSKSLQELRTAQDRLVQTEKLASLGQLTAGIAHEIKNPLNFVNNFSSVSIELIDELQDALKNTQLDAKTSDEVAELSEMLRGNLDKIVQHGKRADSIVKNMLLHSRTGAGEHRPVEINAIVEESLNLAYHGARAEKQGFNITLEKALDPAAGEIDLFPQEITRVFLNLISNGFYAATKRKADGNGGAAYEPILLAATKNLGDRVEIRIRDNGTGIPPEVKDKMFNPFFTTKPAGEGTGLGLSISHDIIVKQHAGTIEVDTKAGEFTEFRITLPRQAASLGTPGA